MIDDLGFSKEKNILIPSYSGLMEEVSHMTVWEVWEAILPAFPPAQSSTGSSPPSSMNSVRQCPHNPAEPDTVKDYLGCGQDCSSCIFLLGTLFSLSGSWEAGG